MRCWPSTEVIASVAKLALRRLRHGLLSMLLILLAVPWSGSVGSAELEIDVQRRLCKGMSLNVYLSDGSEADCVGDGIAIEVDFSDHWAAAIGQSLHYAAVLEQRPGIILVCRLGTNERTCLRHKLRLEETMSYWNIGVMVWFCAADDATLEACQFQDFFGPD